MFAVRYPIRNSDDVRVYICKAKSINNKKSKDVIERYPSLFALGSTPEERESFIKERIKFLEDKEKERETQNTILTIDFNKRIIEPFNNRKNAGFLFLQKVWADLGIEGFLNSWTHTNKLKIKYSLNDALRFLAYSRVIDPGSKLYTSTLVNNYVEDFNLSIDNLYDALDRIPLFADKLTQKLSKATLIASKLAPSDAVYYDCTNFYFEIQNDDDENGLRAHGIEKNHRPDPIVTFGLLFDGNGWPLGCSTFRGNESEKTSLEPLLFAAGEEATKAKIVCADAGLNTEPNKKIIHNSGRNYIFTQSVKSLSDAAEEGLESLKQWAINGKDMVEYGQVIKGKGRKAYKSRWIIRSSGFQERLIVKFDPASRAFLLKTLEKRLERTENYLKNPSRLSHKNAKDGKQYIEKLEINKKTGEVLENTTQLHLDIALIKKEISEAGYSCYVTDIPDEDDFTRSDIRELRENGFRYAPMDAMEIIKIAGKRNDIENCFRIMKSGMQARPIFVRKPTHIAAHLYTVYLGLLLFAALKINYKLTLTDEELFTALRDFSYTQIDNGIYKVECFNEGIRQLIANTGLDDMMYENHTQKSLRKIITQSKNH